MLFRYRMLGLLVVLILHAATGPAAAKSPLWTLEKEGRSVEILGSFHLLDNVDYRDEPAFRRAFERAETVVFETDFSEMQSSGVRKFVRSRGLYKGGGGLRAEIAPELYRSAARAARELGLPPARLNRMRPWLCAVTLTALKYRQIGFLPEYGVDRYFYRRARQGGKEVVALETPEEQIALLAQLPLSVQERMLAQTLQDLELFEEKLSPLLSAWRRGDAERLNRLLLQNFREYPLVYERLVAERNRRWLRRIETLARQRKSVLVVVGAAHVVGPEGLLSLLRERGYRLSRR